MSVAPSRVLPAVVLLLAGLAPATARAEVYKCTGADGRKIYQDRPCESGQQPAPYDPAAFTTIDSEAARREAQEALVTRQAGREEREQAQEARRAQAEPDDVSVPFDPPEPIYYPYPVYPDRDRHHRRPHVPWRPDATPMIEPPRTGGGYVPAPPTIRDVAPRPPSPPRGAGSSRDDR